MPEDQAAWLDQLRTGDEGAVRDMVRAYGGALVRFLGGMTGNTADAEDLAQEAFLRVVRHVSEFRGEASLKTYLFKIAHNLALNHLSSARHRYEVLPDDMPDRPSPEPAPFQAASDEEEARRLRDTLVRLPPQQRAVVMLRTWEDLSFKEIAQTMSLAEGTVKAHYFFALRNLRRMMEAPHDSR